jgi:hypothetical protein
MLEHMVQSGPSVLRDRVSKMQRALPHREVGVLSRTSSKQLFMHEMITQRSPTTYRRFCCTPNLFVF